MKVLDFGSLNVDHVYRVSHIARPGETVAGTAYQRFAGGKGANQAVALARAGAPVALAGCLGVDGLWVRDKLAAEGVDVQDLRVAEVPGGHAVIQVDEQGQNCIVLFPGANAAITAEHIRTALGRTRPGDVLLLQNEINATADLLRAGHAAGLRVVLNPAPMSAAVERYPLECVDLLIVNETEGEALAGGGTADPASLLAALSRRLPGADLCLTLGAAGACYQQASGRRWRMAAPRVCALDTTAAGDTFIGFLLASQGRGADPETALALACRAAAISVTRAGAMDSIPTQAQVEAQGAASSR